MEPLYVALVLISQILFNSRPQLFRRNIDGLELASGNPSLNSNLMARVFDSESKEDKLIMSFIGFGGSTLP